MLTDLDAVGNTPRPSPRASRSRRPCSPRPRCSGRSPSVGHGQRQGGHRATLADTLANLQYIGVLNVSDPKNLVGLIIGASVVFLFSGLAINAVTRAAGAVVFEVRRQFRENPGIMDGTGKPEYGKVVDICTRDSLRELATPGLLAVLAPIAVGFGSASDALGCLPRRCHRGRHADGDLAANSGGAWDNAKKVVEDGDNGGKGSPAHEATIIGDTVGDPFKDTAGPAINPLIKVMNLVALLIAPAVVSLFYRRRRQHRAAHPHRPRGGRGHRRRGLCSPSAARSPSATPQTPPSAIGGPPRRVGLRATARGTARGRLHGRWGRGDAR